MCNFGERGSAACMAAEEQLLWNSYSQHNKREAQLQLNCMGCSHPMIGPVLTYSYAILKKTFVHQDSLVRGFYKAASAGKIVTKTHSDSCYVRILSSTIVMTFLSFIC